MAQIERPTKEMLERLNCQLNLLEEFSAKAFRDCQSDYLAEVANKLRLLIVRSRTNTPLLFAVAEKVGYQLLITFDGPPVPARKGEPSPGDVITLDQYFDLKAITIVTKKGELVLTKRDFIRAWCEKLGGAHEDWHIGEATLTAVRTPFHLNGRRLSSVLLARFSATTLKYGREVVAYGQTMRHAK